MYEEERYYFPRSEETLFSGSTQYPHQQQHSQIPWGCGGSNIYLLKRGCELKSRLTARTCCRVASRAVSDMVVAGYCVAAGPEVTQWLCGTADLLEEETRRDWVGRAMHNYSQMLYWKTRPTRTRLAHTVS